MNQELQAQIFEKLGGLDAKMDLVLETSKNHGSRIRKLELFKMKVLGVVMAVTIMVQAGWAWISRRA
jgi:hypothetical protein